MTKCRNLSFDTRICVWLKHAYLTTVFLFIGGLLKLSLTPGFFSVRNSSSLIQLNFCSRYTFTWSQFPKVLLIAFSRPIHAWHYPNGSLHFHNVPLSFFIRFSGRPFWILLPRFLHVRRKCIIGCKSDVPRVLCQGRGQEPIQT